MTSRSTLSRKIEVLVVTPRYSSPPGGVAQVAAELITIISRRAPIHFTWAGHEELAAAKKAGATDEQKLQTLLPQALLPMQGPALIEKMLPIEWPYWNRQSLGQLRQAIFRADIVWIHDTTYPGGRAAHRLAQKLNRPVLATQHESPVFYAMHGHRLRYAFVRLRDSFMTVPLLKKAQQVTFTSNAAARFYHRRVKFKSAVRVIPNGVEGELFRPPTGEDYRSLRMRFALRDDQPVILFAGRFDTAAGVAIIQRMAELLPKWRFWLAGHGRINPESWYLPNVQVFRDRGGERLADLYKAADLLVMPGSDPDSPQVLQQALACQLPVMCSSAAAVGQQSAARCLIVETDTNSVDGTARQWVQKLKAGKDIWPVPPGGDVPFDSSWDWLQVAAHYSDLLQGMLRTAA